MDVESQEEKRIHSFWKLSVSKDVSIADIVSVVGIGVPLLIWASQMALRMDNIEKRVDRVQQQQEAGDHALDEKIDRLRTETITELREISHKLDDLREKAFERSHQSFELSHQR